jgi:glycosyltransferase involved in cell wall biosynthesis
VAESLRILGVGDAKSRHFARWATRLAELGHEVHVASGRVNPREGELDGLVVHQFQELDPLLRVPLVRRFRMAPALAGLARRVQPDVVHSHYLLPYGYWTARAELGPLGADRAKVHRIFWHARIDGYSPEHADRGRWRALGWPDDAVVCLSLRNFRPYSNLDVVLRSFAKARREVPQLRLFSSAGGGWTRTEFDRLAAELELGPYMAVRDVPAAELPSVTASADFAVTLADVDSSPASLLETMASGVPLVVGLAPSMDEWIQQGEGGELVDDRHDVDAVAAAMVRMAQDAELRRRYGERNLREVHGRFGDPTAQLEQVYREVLAR